MVEDFDAAAWAIGDIDAEEAWVFAIAAGGHDPCLAWGEGIRADAVLAVEFRGGDEFLDIVFAEGVAELGIAEFCGADAFLLFLDAPAAFEGEADGPFEEVVRDRDLGVRGHEFDETADGFLDGGGVAAAEGTAEVDAARQDILAALAAELVPAFREEVADEAEVVGEDGAADFGDVPARHVGVDAVHEGGVVAHFRGEGAEEVADALLVLDIHVEVADHDDAAVGADAFLAAAELA